MRPASTSSEAVALANRERADAGLAALTSSDGLADAARTHAADQADRGRMGHDGSDGTDAGERIARAGYVARTWGENVAAGFGDAGSVVAAWMGSPGHRSSILKPDATHIAIASAPAADGTTYWTLVVAG